MCYSFPDSQWASRYKWGATTWLMFEAVGDLVITASIVYHLKRAKSPFPQTNNFIDKILRSSMENNPASGVAAFIDSIVFLATPTYWHVLFNWMVPKVYILSFIITLNSRAPPVGQNSSQGTGNAQVSINLGPITHVLPITVTRSQSVQVDRDDDLFAPRTAGRYTVGVQKEVMSDMDKS